MKKIFLSLILLGFSSGVALADTTVQSCNRTVTFDAPPERAISIDVNLTEMMLVLGLADRMVGYTGISGWKTWMNKCEPAWKNSQSCHKVPEQRSARWR